MGSQNFKYTATSGRLYQIIGPGHYRPCGGVDFSSIPEITNIEHVIWEANNERYI